MLKVCWWLQGRLFQLWHCVRDQTEQIEKIAPHPPLHILLLFLYFSFLFFYVIFFLPCPMRWHGPFFSFFCIFLCLHFIGIPDIERRKRKRNLLIGQPQGSLSETIDAQCAYVDLQFTFSCGYNRHRNEFWKTCYETV